MTDDIDIGIEIEIEKPDSFLLIKESLTRIGIPSNKNKTLYQTAHILHKRGKYYICHFKELFTLDGKPSDISEDDLERRNLIASLLQDWKLLKIIDVLGNKSDINSVKILSFKEKDHWQLVSKYTLGDRRKK